MGSREISLCFITNYLTHHQLPFCLEMEKRLGNKFRFIETDSLPEERKKLGYKSLGEQYEFVINSCESQEKQKEAMRISAESDVAIIGSSPDSFIQSRMVENKLTFRCAERVFKHGRFDPLRWLKHTLKNLPYRNKNMYYLLNSAYAAKDFVLCGAKRQKMFQWGYFPETKKYEIDELLESKTSASILWVGRLIRWKHPDASINVAHRLKNEGYKFHLTIVGTGEMENELKQAVVEKNLCDCISFVGAVPSDQVRSYMERSEIFLFTSDKNEGWGAVVNEAMNSGCAMVACSAAGAVPCMVANSQNGFTYDFDDNKTLYESVKKIIDFPDLKKELGRNAYAVIAEQWNAENAAARLLQAIDSFFDYGKINPFEDGVLSHALYM